MKTFPALLFCFCLTACGMHSTTVTMYTFQDVPVGASTEEVVQQLGNPYAIHKKPDGTLEYEYIERINAGVRSFEEHHYFLIFKDGKVISRRVKTSSLPPYYRFDSYDMQTTQS